MIILAIFLDTSFLIAFYNNVDTNHEHATKIIKKIKEDGYGHVYTSDYVLDEFFTYMQKRHRNPRFTYELANGWFNLNEGIAEILEVGYETFYNAVKLFIHQKDERKLLSVTDCTIVISCQSNQIQYLATFDDGFDSHILEIVS